MIPSVINGAKLHIRSLLSDAEVHHNSGGALQLHQQKVEEPQGAGEASAATGGREFCSAGPEAVRGEAAIALVSAFLFKVV